MSLQETEEVVPQWLNHDFVENALKTGMKNKDLKILDFDVKLATAKGDNYCSRMFRIALNVSGKGDENEESSKNFSVIVKAIPLGIMGEETRKLLAFEKEKEAFTKTLPELHRILAEANLCKDKLWAECFYSEGPPNDVLVFEDLQLSGFVIGNRLKGLDFEHSSLVLKSLANFHAASIVLKKENPSALEVFNYCYWTPENMEILEKVMKPSFGLIADEILKWTDFNGNEMYAEKMRAIENIIVDKVCEVWQKKEDQMNVLLHGDAWVNNFMFKYDSANKLEGIKLVDFQLTTWRSPALDLQYFIHTSTASDLKFDKVDLFLEIYHEAFIDALKRLGCDSDISYGFDQLKKDFDEKGYWGLIVFFTIFPLMALPKGENVELEKVFSGEGESYFEITWRNEAIKKCMKQGLPYFEAKGLLDVK